MTDQTEQQVEQIEQIDLVDPAEILEIDNDAKTVLKQLWIANIVDAIKLCKTSEEIESKLKNFSNELLKYPDLNRQVNLKIELFKNFMKKSDIEMINNFFKLYFNNVLSGENIFWFFDPFIKNIRIFVFSYEIHQTGIFIGRYQIFTKAHQSIFVEMSQSCQQIVCFVGSDFETSSVTSENNCIQRQNVNNDINIINVSDLDLNLSLGVNLSTQCMPRTKKNPFTTNERIRMIKESINMINPNLLKRISFVPIVDLNDSNLWEEVVKKIISTFFKTYYNGLFGFCKDDSSDYLNGFENYVKRFQKQPYLTKSGEVLNASDIRNKLFEMKTDADLDETVIDPNVKQIAIQIYCANKQQINGLTDLTDLIDSIDSIDQTDPN